MPSIYKVYVNVGESQNGMMVRCTKDGVQKTIKNERAYKMWIRLHNKRCDCLSKNIPVIDTDISLNQYKKTGKLWAESSAWD